MNYEGKNAGMAVPLAAPCHLSVHFQFNPSAFIPTHPTQPTQAFSASFCSANLRSKILPPWLFVFRDPERRRDGELFFVAFF
jgi:hypothetical protein